MIAALVIVEVAASHIVVDEAAAPVLFGNAVIGAMHVAPQSTSTLGNGELPGIRA